MLKTIAIGRLTRNPELTDTASGTPMLTIYILANNGYTNAQGQWVENNNNVRINTYGPRAIALSKSLKKGHKIYATMLTNKTSYVNNEGIKVYTENHTLEDLEIIARTFEEMAKSRQEYSTTSTLETVPQHFSDIPPPGTPY